MGFGSVWFTDFSLMHKMLGVETMISIESDPVIFARATFNKPFRTVEVLEGTSAEVIPALLRDRGDLNSRPWLVWLDYDQVADEEKLEEVQYLLRNLPDNSTFLATFNAQPFKYGKPNERALRLQDLFEDAFDASSLSTAGAAKDEPLFMKALAQTALDFMTSSVLRSGRPGGFVPAYNLKYQDGSPMVTVGGFLPTVKSLAATKALVDGDSWQGILENPIITPPLTLREIATLQAALPATSGLSRSDILSMGFDLELGQIKSFEEHYLRYPAFAQFAH